MRRGLKILVVDDDADFRQMVEGALEGCRVFHAGDGSEALDLIYHHRDLALVITDLDMPKISGDELYRLCREQLFSVPFLIVSGIDVLCDPSRVPTGVPLLSKPLVSLGLLRDLVRKLVRVVA